MLRPVAADRTRVCFIPAVSGFLYTPVFINPTIIGTMPGYYNSAYGITATVAPIKNVYASYGIYDGNSARGDPDRHPRGARSSTATTSTIGEVGAAWQLGAGPVAGLGWRLGGWGQFGKLSAAGVDGERSAGLLRVRPSQRLWLRSPGVDGSGVTGFFQFGINESNTLPVNRYLGGGLTGFGLMPAPAQGLDRRRASRVSTLNESLGFESERGDAGRVLPGARVRRHLRPAARSRTSRTRDSGRALSPATAITLRATVLF